MPFWRQLWNRLKGYFIIGLIRKYLIYFKYFIAITLDNLNLIPAVYMYSVFASTSSVILYLIIFDWKFSEAFWQKQFDRSFYDLKKHLIQLILKYDLPVCHLVYVVIGRSKKTIFQADKRTETRRINCWNYGYFSSSK